jgi:hypothetical protein
MIDDDYSLIPPNQPIDVIVRVCEAPEGTTPQVAMTGSPGEVLPSTGGVAPPIPAAPSTIASVKEALLKETQPSTEIAPKFCNGKRATPHTFSFAARPPGPAIVSVTISNGNRNKEPSTTTLTLTTADGKTTTTISTPPPSSNAGTTGGAANDGGFHVEMLVPHVYSSALRLGLALVGGAADHSYSARKPPGGDVATIVDNGAPYLTPEITLGFAPFFDGLRRRHGRVYTHYHQSPWHLAPYIGVGVLSATTGQVQWLRSLYVGIEYEFFSNCSIALAAVLRRTDALSPGLNVGDPVGDMTTLTSSRYAAGIGVVFNFTPDFLKFAGLGLK